LKKPARRPASSDKKDGRSTREFILSVALTSFARDGFDGASIPKIANLAGVAPALLHYYFGSKDKLWRDTVEYSLGELRRETSTIHNATKSLLPLDRLRALLQAHTHFAARWPDHFVMIIAEARADSDRFAWIQENYTGILFDEVVTTLLDAQSRGQIEEVNVNKVASILIGSILLYFTVQSSTLRNADYEADSSEFTELLFRMLLNGVGIPPS